MKNRRIKVMMVLIIFALSLGTGGLAMAMEDPPPAANAGYVSDNSSTQTDYTQTNDDGSNTEQPTEYPVFTTHPQSQNVIVGQDVSFTVAATGKPSPTLQWQVSTNGGHTWTDIVGQTGTTLRLNPVNHNHSGNQYRNLAVNSAGEVASNVAVLIVNTATNAFTPRIVNQPGSTTVTMNSSATLSVTADVSDRGTLSYQWYSNTADRNTGGTMIHGATGRTFTPSTTHEGTTFYYVVVTNTNNYASGARTASIVSNTARVVVNPLVNALAPVITEQPVSVEVTMNGRAPLFVTARTEDNGRLSYQWFRNDTNSNTGGTAISGATDLDFRPATNTLGIVYYYVVVTNTNNNVNGERTATATSQAVQVSVITTPDAPLYLYTVIDGNTVTLSWEAPENDGGGEIIGYQVSDNIVTFWIDANGVYEHTFEDLGFDREYTFMVRAVNAAGAGEVAELMATTDEEEIVEEEIEEEEETEEYYLAEYDADNNHLLLWLGLGTLAPLGTGTGVYFWRRKNRRIPKGTKGSFGNR